MFAASATRRGLCLAPAIEYTSTVAATFSGAPDTGSFTQQRGRVSPGRPPGAQGQ